MFLLQGIQVHGQKVWPGDIDRDGVVSGQDAMFWGHAHSEQGSQRNVISSEWKKHKKPTPKWVNYFPTGDNCYFGDCNGDGDINMTDLGSLIYNYDKKKDPGSQKQVNIGSKDPNVNYPRVIMEGGADTILFQGDNINLTLDIGETNLPVSNIYGVTFEVYLDPILLALISYFNTSLQNTSFFNANQAGVDASPPLQSAASDGIIDVNFVRTDGVEVSGNGIVADMMFGGDAIGNDICLLIMAGFIDEFFTISIDNVIFYDYQLNAYHGDPHNLILEYIMPPPQALKAPNLGTVLETLKTAEKYQSLREENNNIPQIIEATDNTITQKSVSKINTQHGVYPNPATDAVTISGTDITNVVVYNIQGQVMEEAAVKEGMNNYSFTVEYWTSGMYVVHTQSVDGTWKIEKLVVQ